MILGHSAKGHSNMKRGWQLLAFADSMSRRVGLDRVSLREGDRNRAPSRINRAVSASAVAMPPKQKRKPAHKGAKKAGSSKRGHAAAKPRAHSPHCQVADKCWTHATWQ
jgi:hypothetical protein